MKSENRKTKKKWRNRETEINEKKEEMKKRKIK